MANTKLSGCLQLVGRMPQKDQDALLARIDELRNGGVSAEQAQFVAADDMLAQILAERGDFTRMLREQHPDLFATDVRGMFDELLVEEKGASAAKPRSTRPPAGQRTAGQAAASAAQNTAAGLSNAVDGLVTLFGAKQKGRLNSGLGFDEETYAQAKPLFQAALANMKDAASDIREAMRAIIRMVLQKAGQDAAANMKEYVVRFIEDVQSGKINLEADNVSTTGGNSQSGGQDGEAEAPSGTETVRNDAAGSGQVSGGTGGRAGSGGARSQGDSGVSDAGSAAGGKRGDQSILGEDGRLDIEDGPAGAGVQGGSGGDSGPRADADAATAESSVPVAPLAERLERQKAAEGTPVKFGDAANIRETLPLLMPSQHEDVLTAEKRLTQPDGYGMLFTNGTGTGKTFLGLGIIKRMHKAGKTRGLIVVPNDAVKNEWTRSAQDIGLRITQLADTNDKGAGIAITTYANLANNRALADRDIDFLVADEAHNLMSNAAAEVTAGLRTARAITLHPESAIDRARMIERVAVDRLAVVKDRYEYLNRMANRDDTMDQMRDAYLREADELEKERVTLQAKYDATLKREKEKLAANQGEKRTRAIFLSATPFAYEKNTDWAEGYLFQYPAESTRGGYNQPSGREQFMIQNFGYRMRYGKLTEPDAAVDRNVMQRQFNSYLRQRGVLSARMLNVDKDYDRKFVLIDGGIGTRIDQALKWMRETKGGLYAYFYGLANDQFDYLSRSRLLEAIKAKAAIPYIEAQHKLGRKVVVFYDYNEGGGFNPFDFGKNRDSVIGASVLNPETGKVEEVSYKQGEFLDAFAAEFPDLLGASFDKAMSPLDTLTEAFPSAGVYNGIVQKSGRQQKIDDFNNDNKPEANLLIVQSAANAGWSGHDKTGKFQRVLINLGLPVAPTKAIQQEGRIYRVGQSTDAIFRYFNTGTLWEKMAFATKVARRASTAENLAMGEDARGLLQSFLDAFENSGDYPPAANEGKGGKAIDREATALLSDFDRAKSFYYGQLKRNQSTKAAEGVDYFATPEPIGLKMAQWLHANPGDRLLEPSAGHGAIARWFPDTNDRTVIEPSLELSSRLALITDAKQINERFETLNLVNKYNGIAMNPPFGVGGKTAIDHLAKAFNHLSSGGRIVAMIPEGPAADAKFDAWLYAQDDKGRSKLPNARLAATISLPTSTFNRAGTAVKTRIVIIDKIDDPKVETPQVNFDLSKNDDINDLFKSIEMLDVPRPQSAVVEPVVQGKKDAAPQAKPGRVVDKLDDATFEVKDGKLVTDSPEVSYTTAKGKVLKGVYVPFPTMAKEVDDYTFRARGMPGNFVRMEHVVRPSLDQGNENSATDEEYFDIARSTASDKKNSLTDARISPRRPTAVKAGEDSMGQDRLQPDLESAKRLGKGFTRNINLMAAYPNFYGITGTAEQKSEKMIQHMVDNLLWLHNQWGKKNRARTKLWYLGGNRIAARWSERFGTSIQRVVSAIAATSPQKDWFQNVSIAERILEALSNNADVPFDAKMRAAAMSRSWGAKKSKTLRKIEGKTLRELYDPNDDASLIDMAVWIRAWDEANNPQMARVITPEGAFKNDWDRGKTGKPIGFRWQSFPTIARTIKALSTDDRAAISEIIGSNHKVRSFFNNLVAPLFGMDVTIDTHAVAAALLRPLGSASIEVLHNFGSGQAEKKDADGNIISKGIPGTANSSILGLYGTYAIYAEAYRRAAKDAKISPREMQSITWEAVRGLFRPEQKNERIKRQVNAIWTSVAKGEVNVNEARERISKLVDGIRDPAWAGSDAGVDEAGRDSSYASRVSQGGGSSGTAVGRGGDGAAGGIQDQPAGLASPATSFTQVPEPVRANTLAKLKSLERKLSDGKITEPEYRLGIQQAISALETRNEVQAERAAKDRRRGADWIVAQMRRGVADGTVGRTATEFAEWLIDQNPNIVNDLGISIPTERGGNGVAGSYNPGVRVFTLFSGANDQTAVHEILHHSERMMPKDVQAGILKEWKRAWDAAFKAGDMKTRAALNDMLAASIGDKEAHERVLGMFEDGTLDYDKHYQLYSASEFWAVNATRILSGRFEAKNSIFVKKAIQWFKEFVQRIKGAFGLPSDAPLLKALDAVMAGDGQFVTKQMLSKAAAYNAIGGPTPPPVPNTAQAPINLVGGQNLPAWDLPEPSLMDKTIYRLQDRLIDLKRVQQSINEVRTIPEQFDTYLKEELFHGRVAARTDKFLKNELKPLLVDMKARGVTLDKLESYLWARHAKERNAQIASINPQMPDGGSGLTDAQVDDYFNGVDVLDPNGEVIVDGLDSGQLRHLQALAARVDAMNAGTKQVLIQYGLEDPNTIAAWDSVYKNYVPLHREDMNSTTPIGQGFSVRGSASKRAFGSKLKVVDILASLALQREAAITRGEKNRVGMALYGLALQNPHPDFWEAGKVPTKRVQDPNTGLVITVPDMSNRDDVMMVRLGGKDRAIKFNKRNKQAMQAVEILKNLDIQKLGDVLGTMSVATRYFASINTQYNPIFGILNGIRDVQAATLNLTTTPLRNHKWHVMRQVPAAMRAIWRIERGRSGGVYDAIYEQMKMAGGTTGYRELFRVGADRAKKIQSEIDALNASSPRKAFNWLLQWLDDYNTAIENATRMAAYRVGVDIGLSQEKAASTSKNITVNFNRKGRLGNEAGALYAFINAAAQGTARMIETLRGPAGKKIMAGGVALGVLQTIIAMMAFDDEEWEEIPEFIKSRNFIIPSVGAGYHLVPMPLGFNFLPNIGRIASEWVARSGGKDPGKYVSQLLLAVLDAGNPLGSGTMAQMIAPTVLDPIISLAENKDFTGRPIAKKDMSSLSETPGFTRARDTSSTVSRYLAEGFNFVSGGTKYTPGGFHPTPDQIDYIFGQLTGGVGRELNRAYQSIEIAARGEDVPEHRKPLWGRFYGRTDEDSSVTARYWRNVKELNQLEQEYKGRLKDGGDVKALETRHPEVGALKIFNKHERQVAILRSERHRVEFEESMKEADRTVRLKKLDDDILLQMKNYNSQITDIKKRASKAD